MHTKDLTHHAILSKSTVNSPRDRGPARTRPAGPLRAAALSTCRPHAPGHPKWLCPFANPASAVLYFMLGSYSYVL